MGIITGEEYLDLLGHKVGIGGLIEVEIPGELPVRDAYFNIIVCLNKYWKNNSMLLYNMYIKRQQTI